MDGTMDGDQVGKGLRQASHAGLPAMRGAVIHDPEHAAGVAIRRLGHDLGDEPSEGLDSGGCLATAKDLGAVYVERRQVGPWPISCSPRRTNRLDAVQLALPLDSPLTQQHELIRETDEYAKFFATAVSAVNTQPVPTPGEPDQ